MTPEARVKKKVRSVLEKFGEEVYIYMPVPGGFGRQTLDYLGFFRGYGFAIETKAPGKKPTDRQRGTIEAIEKSGTKVFVIDDDAGCLELAGWLAHIVTITTVVERITE